MLGIIVGTTSIKLCHLVLGSSLLATYTFAISDDLAFVGNQYIFVLSTLIIFLI